MKYKKTKDGSVTISDIFVGVTLKADDFPGQLIVVQRDGELLIRLSEDGGESWTPFEQLKLLFPGYVLGLGNDQPRMIGGKPNVKDSDNVAAWRLLLETLVTLKEFCFDPVGNKEAAYNTNKPLNHLRMKIETFLGIVGEGGV